MSFWEDLKLQYKIGDIGQKLIFLNVIIFIISIIFFYNFRNASFLYPEYIALSGNWKTSLLFFYTFFSYMFFHAGFMHLIFNMLYLSFSTRLFLTIFNEKQFITTYIFGGIFAGIIYVLYASIFQTGGILVGASAAILAVLFTVVFYHPNMNVRLLLVGNVKLWHIGLFLFVLDILYFKIENSGGHVAHVGGIIFAFINYLLLKNGRDISKMFTFNFKKEKKNTFKKVYTNNSSAVNKSVPTENETNQKKVDDILDKISKSGYDSLTKEEKEFLFKQN